MWPSCSNSCTMRSSRTPVDPLKATCVATLFTTCLGVFLPNITLVNIFLSASFCANCLTAKAGPTAIPPEKAMPAAVVALRRKACSLSMDILLFVAHLKCVINLS